MSQRTDAAWLLDVNALIALIDPEHVHHERIQNWFGIHFHEGWATCPLTENGALRVLCQRAYPSGRRAPAEVISSLRGMKENHRGDHVFFSESISISDASLFEEKHFTSGHHVTDIYLLAIAHTHDARLVSFDRHLPGQAIRGGSAKLVEHPV